MSYNNIGAKIKGHIVRILIFNSIPKYHDIFELLFVIFLITR